MKRKRIGEQAGERLTVQDGEDGDEEPGNHVRRAINRGGDSRAALLGSQFRLAGREGDAVPSMSAGSDRLRGGPRPGSLLLRERRTQHVATAG